MIFTYDILFRMCCLQSTNLFVDESERALDHFIKHALQLFSAKYISP